MGKKSTLDHKLNIISWAPGILFSLSHIIQHIGVINDNEFNKYMDLAEKYEDAETAFELTNSEYRVKIKNMFKELLNSKGYDSIKYWNTFDAGPTMDQLMSGETSNVTPGWSYIVFSNKQIKTP